MSDEIFLLFKPLFCIKVSIFDASLQGIPFILCLNELRRDLGDSMLMLVFFQAVLAIDSLFRVVDAVDVETDVEDAIFAAAALGGSLHPHVIEDGG